MFRVSRKNIFCCIPHKAQTPSNGIKSSSSGKYCSAPVMAAEYATPCVMYDHILCWVMTAVTPLAPRPWNLRATSQCKNRKCDNRCTVGSHDMVSWSGRQQPGECRRVSLATNDGYCNDAAPLFYDESLPLMKSDVERLARP